MDRAGPTRSVVTFCRALRSEGLSVPVSDVFTYVHALGVMGVRRTDDVYWAGRATLLRRPEDIEAYDRVFSAYWSDVEASRREHADVSVITKVQLAHDDGGAAEGEGGEG